MRRRDALKVLGTTAAGAQVLAGGCVPGKVEGVRSRPDVLLIMTDQFNPACTGYAGEPIIQTPHLDRLAREGTAFDACYTNSPVCMPARACLATGQMPHEHGYWSNHVQMFPAERITLFGDVRRAGYTTAKIGKFHYFASCLDRPDFRDYADYYRTIGLDYADELSTPFSTPDKVSAFSDHLLRRGLLDTYVDDIIDGVEAGQFLCKPSPVPAADVIDSFACRRALAFLDRQPTGKPYFLFVSFPGPHTPLDAAGEYATMYDPAEIALPRNVRISKAVKGLDHVRRVRSLYYGKVSLLDTLVGRLLDALRRRGTLDNTLILFTADHGDLMGEHGAFGKVRFWDGSARVPLLMRWPGRAKPGLRTDALAELNDLYATIIDAIGGVMASTAHGQSLLGVAGGEPRPVRDACFSEIGPGTALNYMVRTRDHKYFVERGRERLFSVARDPHEMRDLARSKDASHRRVLADMRGRLEAFAPPNPPNHTRGYVPRFQRMRAGSPGKAMHEILIEKREESRKRLKASRFLGDASPEPPCVK